MPFFFSEITQEKNKTPIKTAHELECRVCPLNKNSAFNGKMLPEGSKNPVIYFLSDFPESEDDETNRHFIGNAGKYIRKVLPKELDDVVRFNYIVRTRPDQGKIGSGLEIECCRPSIIRDIEQSKPDVIVGFGADVLEWALKESGIFKWRGRFVPVIIGNHQCLFYSMLDPYYIKSKQRFNKQGKVFETEYDLTFRQDFEKLLDYLETDYTLEIEVKDYLKGVEISKGLKSNNELKKVLNWLEKLKEEQFVGIDIETNCLKPYEENPKILTISIGTDKKTYSFPIDYDNSWSVAQLKTLKDELKNFLLDEKVVKIAHNIKFEQEWLSYFFGREVLFTKWEDTQAQAYLIDERRGMLSLDVLVRINFGFWLKSLSNLDRDKMEDYTLDEILPYNALDTKYTYKLFFKQQKQLDSILVNCYKHLVKVTTTLTSAQSRGLLVNKEYHSKVLKECEDRLKIIEHDLKQLKEIKVFERKFGLFNPASSAQVLSVLKDIFKLKNEIKNSKGEYSTDEPILAAVGNEFTDLILKHRSISKKKSTYIDPVLQHTYGDGRIHTNFNPYTTTTGRLSSNAPNMQNWPNRKGKDIRQMIKAEGGQYIVCADYGQIEARLIGAASQDENFIKYLWNPKSDIHKDWAIKISNAYPKVYDDPMYESLTEEKALKKFRGYVKNQWVFPAFYGSSIYSIAKTLKLPKNVANDLFNEFWITFKGVKEWQQWIMNFYKKNGYVESMYGRRRRSPLSYNECINSTIQSTASDICVEAMTKLDRSGINVVLNVHDDITSYVYEENLEDDILKIAEIMSSISKPWLNIPLAVEITYGKDWYHQEEVDTFLSTEFIEVPDKLLHIGYYRKSL